MSPKDMSPKDSAKKDFLYNHQHNDMVRSDYRPDPYRITDADLYINLDATETRVRNRMVVEGNPASQVQGGPLVLQGEDMDLVSVKIKENGKWRDLDRAEFRVDDKQLIINRPPQGRFELEIVNEINPSANTRLQGIYASGDIIGSQCESTGFRRVTYFLDRPDNLARFTTTLEADKEKYPVLISNGNGDLAQTKDLGQGRHSITWVDPFPKPSYLFATIAGDMEVVTDTFTTMAGNDVALRIVVPKGYEDKVAWAMQSIKNAMKWDEEKYGLAYDLDCLHLIGLEKFNMGAMENKGAIVFNIKDLCGAPDSSSDAQLLRIETVIGHEYFHNYTGDRVTVRDWFEISLKESLTERRNEQFSGDMNSKSIQTLDDAVYIRTVQFREDEGPTAHCVRPERVEAFENIYSPTVYNKGAQLLRMMETIMGSDNWYKGVKHYLDKFDGEARIVEDFVAALEEYSGRDLAQFFRWYTQAGTPEISYDGRYDAAAKTYTLTLKQHQPATPGQPASSKKPLHIPVRLGLIAQSGKDIPLKLQGETAERKTDVFDFTEKEQTFVFENVSGPVVPSLFRDFSAPVKVVTPVSDDELIFRMSHDSDPFNRFDAGQQMMAKTMRQMLEDLDAGKPLALPPAFTAAYGLMLADGAGADPAFTARLLGLPPFTQDLKQYDPLAAKTVADFVKKTLAAAFETEFRELYAQTAIPAGKPFSIHDMGWRDLHNTALSFLSALETPAVKATAQAQYDGAANMTERQGALAALARMGGAEAEKALESFHQKYRNDTNVMDTWLSLSASAAQGDAIERVRALMKSDVFDITNPNKVRALLGGFTGNTAAFHNKDGSGYRLLADVIITLNGVNPHTATGIIRPLAQFQRYDDARQELVIAELERIMKTPQLDTQIKDIVGKALESARPSLKGKTKSFDKKQKP